MFKSVYSGKTVLVTGHTGFKGAWLCSWLIKLGAKVVGISREIPTQPSLFEALGLETQITHVIGDVNDAGKLRELFDSHKPDFLFHLAAQALVSMSLFDPIDTVASNVLGTTTVLQVLREQDHEISAVIITSDKCYENQEWIWGYRESDTLGGKDIYSASKAAAELIFLSFHKSVFTHKKNIRLATARAGNVIGGGDWSKDRIVADCFVAWSQNIPVTIRNPLSTRPWQHVLEPLSGYLNLGQYLSESADLSGQSYNFGPVNSQNVTVAQLLNDLFNVWGTSHSGMEPYLVESNQEFNESGLLRLNCEKTAHDISWDPTLNYSECIMLVSQWYKMYYSEDRDVAKVTNQQLEDYMEMAVFRKRIWTV